MRFSLAIAALAVTVYGQASTCEIKRDPAKPVSSKKFVCGLQGRLSNPSRTRDFPSPTEDETGCASACYSDPTCKSFSWNDQTNQCQLYSTTVRGQGFSRQKGTHEFFYYQTCFLKTGECDVANGGFEDGSAVDAGNEGQSNTYRPWAFTGTDGSTAEVTPYGENDAMEGLSYMDITTSGGTAILSQDLTLLGGVNYTLAYDFSAYVNDDSGIYSLQFTFDGNVIRSETIPGFAYRQDPVWMSRSFSFVTLQPKIMGRPQRLEISVSQLQGGQDSSMISLGLDDVHFPYLSNPGQT